MKPIIIIGAGRAARFSLDICQATRQYVAGVAVDGASSLAELPTLQTYRDILEGKVSNEYRYLIAVGNPDQRALLHRVITDHSGELASAIHPNTVISPQAQLGAGIIVNAFTSVLPGAHIGDACLVEDHCGIGVDVKIGASSTVAPGAFLNAASSVGDRCFIGSGVTVNPEKRIGDHCMVGAGAAVTSDLPSQSVAAGVPARVLRFFEGEMTI